MSYSFDNERPIYVQLVEKLELDIISGKLKPGERISSVRELALTLKVNPNTLQKALAELESGGLIYTERTNGKFVTENKEIITARKKELAKEKTKKFIDDMNSIGIEFTETIDYLKRIGGNNNETTRM